MDHTIRRIEERDFARWRELFDGYTRFYEREPDEALTRHTWSRILNPAVPMHSIIAQEAGGRVVGIANYLLHESFAHTAPLCYLQDLYVDPKVRAGGAGKAMIDWLLGECKAHGWPRLYWNTRETNYRARGLYDKYGPHSGFLRYAVNLRAA